MNMMWLLRAKRLMTHPPSLSRVVLVFAVIGLCVALYAAEQWGLLPDWVAAERTRVRPVK